MRREGEQEGSNSEALKAGSVYHQYGPEDKRLTHNKREMEEKQGWRNDWKGSQE